MTNSVRVRIDISAEKELARWKAVFADEVCARARQLATRSGNSGLVTLSHYRQAAENALQSLTEAIHKEEAGDARQKAA